MTTERKSKSFYNPDDFIRLGSEFPSNTLEPEPYRTEFRRDYGRLIHCPSFRRLNGKTQLYPGQESDFFRNRLSHSIEVAQIAKSIAIRLNNKYKFNDGCNLDLDFDLVEFAALAHDIGHPPFGHQGEEALDQCMLNHGGFEGNAQTLRIITKLEKKFLVDSKNAPYGVNDGKDIRLGLNLCPRTIASVLKYDNEILDLDKRLELDNLTKEEVYKLKPVKGYYSEEKEIVKYVVASVLQEKELPIGLNFKTVECSIMDLADDIAYSTYDFEDGLKGGFFHPLDMIFSNQQILNRVSERVSKLLNKDISVEEIRDIFIEVFDRWLFPQDFSQQYEELSEEKPIDAFKFFLKNTYQTSKELAKSGYARTSLTSFLVGKFVRGIEININNEIPALSRVCFNNDTKLIVEVFKTYNYESMIVSPRLKVAEYRGKEIVKTIFDALNNKDGSGIHLMPKDFQELYYSMNDKNKPRVLCDYIAGMTDRYCIEFYGRLKSESPETIFKPF